MTPRTERRIWHVISNRWNSAVTEYALSCARASRLLGWRTVVSPLAGRPCEGRAREAQLDTKPFKRFGPTALLEFQRRYREIRPTHVFVYGGQEFALALSLPRETRLIRFRGQDEDMKRLPTPWARRVAERRLDAYLFPNAILDQRFRVGARVPTKVIPLGCDASRFQPRGAWREQPSREILCVGRFDPVKGHQRLFHMFSRAREATDNQMTLRIIGEPANITAAEVRAMARASGLVESREVVIQDERVANLSHVMERAVMGVIPSLDSEVIGRVGEEFLLCGTPILVSGAGALNELLFAGGGVSYEGKNLDGAAALLVKLFDESRGESPETRAARSLEARRRFSLEAMAKALDEFVLQLG